MKTNLSLCVPTAKRPKILGKLLDNISSQRLIPDEIIIIDGANETETKNEVDIRKKSFDDGVLQYYPSQLGLTLQRNIGIDICKSKYICMLDDDVILEPDCLEKMVEFLNSEEGNKYAAISAFISNNYGRDFFKMEKFLNKIQVYDGELKPGRWLYCGAFLVLSTLKQFDGVYDTQFIPGGAAIFRKKIIDDIRPDSNFKFIGEDKHWTLRISQKYKIGVLGNAKLIHDHVSVGVRKTPFKRELEAERNLAIILVDCDENLTLRRYLFFFSYRVIKNTIDIILNIYRLRFDMLTTILGRFIGSIINIIPPRYFNNHFK